MHASVAAPPGGEPDFTACSTHAGGCAGSDGAPLPVWRLATGAVVAGQSMVIGLGYSTALRAGEGPQYGSAAYLAVHGLLLGSVLGVCLLLGGPLLRGLWQALRARQITIEALFVLSLVGALLGSLVSSFTGQTSVYYEVVAVVLVVYTLGSSLTRHQRERALAVSRSLAERHAWAWTWQPGTAPRRVAVAQLTVGDLVDVFPGGVIAVDGVVVSGQALVREAAVTGEPLAVRRGPGDRVLAGTHSVDGQLKIRVEQSAGERMLDHIVAAVDQMAPRPSALQVQSARIMRWFVPAVAAVAALTCVGWLTVGGLTWPMAVFHGMSVLLIACPCALGLALPIGLWSAFHRLGQCGVVTRSGRLLDTLAQLDAVVFDKTGTLTHDDMAVESFAVEVGCPWDTQWLKRAVASLEAGLDHPLARTLSTLAAADLPVRDRQLLAGRGVAGWVAVSSDADHWVRVTCTATTDNGGSGCLELAMDGGRVGAHPGSRAIARRC
jgi:cation transport ATPase